MWVLDDQNECLCMNPVRAYKPSGAGPTPPIFGDHENMWFNKCQEFIPTALFCIICNWLTTDLGGSHAPAVRQSTGAIHERFPFRLQRKGQVAQNRGSLQLFSMYRQYALKLRAWQNPILSRNRKPETWLYVAFFAKDSHRPLQPSGVRSICNGSAPGRYS